ncbi:hypothetical protein Tcan_00954, partial [Toxocara canis]
PPKHKRRSEHDVQKVGFPHRFHFSDEESVTCTTLCCCIAFENSVTVLPNDTAVQESHFIKQLFLTMICGRVMKVLFLVSERVVEMWGCDISEMGVVLRHKSKPSPGNSGDFGNFGWFLWEVEK